MSEPTSEPAANADQLLLIHGWWGGAWVWDQFIPHFEQAGYRCHAMDLASGNATPNESENDSFAAYQVRIVEQVERLGRPIVMGHSAGGLQAQKLAERFDLPAVVLLGSAAPRGILPLRTLRLLAATIRHAPEILLGRPLLPGRHEMCLLNLNGLPPEEQDYVYQRMVSVSAQQVIDVAFKGVPVDESKINTPMLVINGTHDRLTPPVIAKAISRKFDATYIEYPDNAHYLMREPHNQEIAADILQWLAKVTTIR